MLLQIKKENVNQIAVTLTEKADLDLPINWLFRFIREQSNKDYFCFLTDLSTSPNRFNLFHLFEGTDVVLPEGEYKYEIYQKSTLDEDYSTGILCETGKAKVFTDPEIIKTFENTTTLINVYE